MSISSRSSTDAIRGCWPRPKLLFLNFPSNPTTECVELPFFERVIEIARQHGIWVVQDLAYADLVFDGYVAPSILQVPGAKDIAVEFFSLSKSYNMPGWRVGFMVGNPTLVKALARLKSYLDYGIFTPIQVAAIAALDGPQDCLDEIRELYRKRRNVLCDGLNSIGWPVERPRGTMFVWAPIPDPYRRLGSLEFSKKLLLAGQGGRVSRHRFRGLRRWLRTLRAHRERAPYPPGDPRDPRPAQEGQGRRGRSAES